MKDDEEEKGKKEDKDKEGEIKKEFLSAIHRLSSSRVQGTKKNGRSHHKSRSYFKTLLLQASGSQRGSRKSNINLTVAGDKKRGNVLSRFCLEFFEFNP